MARLGPPPGKTQPIGKPVRGSDDVQAAKLKQAVDGAALKQPRRPANGGSIPSQTTGSKVGNSTKLNGGSV